MDDDRSPRDAHWKDRLEVLHCLDTKKVNGMRPSAAVFLVDSRGSGVACEVHHWATCFYASIISCSFYF